MLALGQQVGGQKLGVRRLVRQHHHFARPGKKIDGYGTHQLALGLYYKPVAGAENLFHGLHAFRTQRQRGDRLGAAYLDNFRGTGSLQRI